MADESRNSKRDREAASSKPRSRWDRSSRDQPPVPTKHKSDDHNDSGPSAAKPSGEHKGMDRTYDSPEPVHGIPSSKRRRFTETDDADNAVPQPQTQSNATATPPPADPVSPESKFQSSFPYKDEGTSDDDDSNEDTLRDEALERHYKAYEAECKALATQAKSPSPDSEPHKRGFSTAVSTHDQAPSADEPQLKKPGFSLTMGSSQGASVPTVLAPRPASGFGFSMALGKAKPLMQTTPFIELPKKPAAPIKMSLGVQKPKAPTAIRKPTGVANVFNEDDDSDDEEMPPEAKMRMRNLGRETPTAAGPNSFGKGNLGFCDRHKIIQRELQKKMDEVGSKN